MLHKNMGGWHLQVMFVFAKHDYLARKATQAVHLSLFERLCWFDSSSSHFERVAEMGLRPRTLKIKESS
jgi:hypothetical protein